MGNGWKNNHGTKRFYTRIDSRKWLNSVGNRYNPFFIIMGNIREERKKSRIAKIRAFVEQAKKENKEIKKESIVSWLIVEFAVGKKTALEEVEAVLMYDK